MIFEIFVVFISKFYINLKVNKHSASEMVALFLGITSLHTVIKSIHRVPSLIIYRKRGVEYSDNSSSGVQLKGDDNSNKSSLGVWLNVRCKLKNISQRSSSFYFYYNKFQNSF